MLATRVVLWETRNMESDPMLEEVWRIKDQWACEAGDDTHRPCQNVRQRTAGHFNPGLVVHGGEDLCCVVTEVRGPKFGKDVIMGFLEL
jgi:hypothetical protein